MKRGILVVVTLLLSACGGKENNTTPESTSMKNSAEHKEVVYQVFTRLFGNTKTANIPWGSLEENGVGKFSDFDEKALKEIKNLGVTYIWYTGVPHHALIQDYTAYGISNDDPDVVKGRAGSPYAVKDYYNVNPDLADDPSRRLEEFEALIDRTHKAGLKVLIDIVPNHVARNYEGKTNPKGVVDFGANDDTSVEYDRNNNFYYIPGSSFEVPQWEGGYRPLGGELNPLADNRFTEVPAKWTGNGSRSAQPGMNDWYETIKVNYGVRPDGTKDFPELPEQYAALGYEAHAAFWKQHDLPDSWKKFRDIALYWTKKGVDGFRFDMAEMVPVEFWSFLNSSIKLENPHAFLLAEVYNPDLYRAYIHKGKMDYLYDKVELYDSIKHIVKGYGWTDHLAVVQEGLKDIEHHMLHFLENHDEQRIASPDFAGSAEKGKPAMVVSATLSTSPTMIYFGQEVGEPGKENAGFGQPTRTSIFDYIGVPHHQRWVNEGQFDGGQLSEGEKKLRDFYKRLLNFSIKSSALMGEYQEFHFFNKDHSPGYDHRVFSFVRWSNEEHLLIISNFDEAKSYELEMKLPRSIVQKWKLEPDNYLLQEQLYGIKNSELKVPAGGAAEFKVQLDPLESLIFKLKRK